MYYATQNSLYGTQRLSCMRKRNETINEKDIYIYSNIFNDTMDIIPLEISRIDQIKVYTLQVICYTTAKALYIV